MDRTELLFELREKLEHELWAYGVQFERMLRDLVHVVHVDPQDPAAIGAVVHSALPSADLDVKGRILKCKHTDAGPSNKLVGIVDIGGIERHVSLEWHYAGPLGGTRKSKHQHAVDVDLEEASLFDIAGVPAPENVLMFVPYYLAPSRTTIERLYLGYADGVDKRRIQLHRPMVAAAPIPASELELPAAKIAVKGTLVKAKKPRKGDEGDVGTFDKRGDGTSGA